MCLTIPGRVVRVLEATPEGRVAEVDFAGSVRRVNLLFLPEATVGDYVVAHAGYATGLVDEAEALEAQAHWREIQRLTAPEGS